MTELYIQVEALRRAYAAAKADSLIALGAGRGAGVFSLLPDIVDISVKTAAPLVVAAELARLMDRAFSAPDGSDLDPEEYEAGYRVLHDLVIERIDELAPHLRRASELRGEVQP